MSASLTVDHLAIACHVGSAGGHVQRAQRVLDRVIGSVMHELPALITRVLATEPDSDEIVFVPSVHFDATVNAAWPADQIARALVAPLMRSLWRSMADPGTIRFRDRAELLARFILDLSQGYAYVRDWHEEFEGLKLLPASAILRTLVTNERDAARIGLARLLPDQLRRCVALLSGSDARRVLKEIECIQASSDLTLRALVDVLISQNCFALNDAHDQINFAIAVVRETGHTLDASTLALARAAVAVAGEAGTVGLSEEDCRDRLFSAVMELMRSQGSGSALRAGLDQAFLGTDSALDILTGLKKALGVESAVERRCFCAGPWLLLPAIVDFIGAHVVGEHLATCALAAAALCAGEDANKVWWDEVLREGLSLEEKTIARSIDQFAWPLLTNRGRPIPLTPWLARRSRAIRHRDLLHFARAANALQLPRSLERFARRAAYRALLSYAQRLPGFAEASFSHLWGNFLRAPAYVRTYSDPAQFEVLLERPPLDVIWRISGADRAAYSLPSGCEVRVRVASR